jgi:hypothetical protein
MTDIRLRLRLWTRITHLIEKICLIFISRYYKDISRRYMATTTLNRKYQKDNDNNSDNDNKSMLEGMKEIEAKYSRLSNAFAKEDPSLLRE